MVTRFGIHDAKALADAIRNSKRPELSPSEIVARFETVGYDSKSKCKDIYKMYEEVSK